MKRVVRLLVLMWLFVPAVQAHEGHAETFTHEQTFIDQSLLGFSGLREAFNVHPAFVHFPVALFPSALLLYGLGTLMKRPSWIVAGRACLYLAAASTAVTFITGWQAQETFPHNQRLHHMMMSHLHLGLIIGVCAIVLTFWSFAHRAQQPKGIYGFLLLLAGTTSLVLQNGDLGSRMVYLEGAAVKPAVSSITEESQEAGPHHSHSSESEDHAHH